MQAKDTEGNFRPDFLDIRWGKDYAEGSAWHQVLRFIKILQV